jgi:hypothetical protein
MENYEKILNSIVFAIESWIATNKCDPEEMFIPPKIFKCLSVPDFHLHDRTLEFEENYARSICGIKVITSNTIPEDCIVFKSGTKSQIYKINTGVKKLLDKFKKKRMIRIRREG